MLTRPNTGALIVPSGLIELGGAGNILGAVPKTISATTYTLLASDFGKRLIFTAATEVTVTVPASLPLNYEVTLQQKGAGQVVLTGQTINNASSHTKLSGQHAIAALLGEPTVNVYTLTGSTGA